MSLSSSPFRAVAFQVCIAERHSRPCNYTSTVLPVGHLKINRILKFFRKFYITLAGIELCTAPILHTHFKLGEGLGCEGILGQFVSPKKIQGSLKEKEEPEVDFRQVAQSFYSSC